MAVLILGAAGGIGGSLARRLAAQGVNLVLAGRDASRLEALAAETGGTPFVLDARNPAEVEAAAAKAVEAHGLLDGLANCVGSILLKPAHLTSEEEWDAVVSTNLKSAYAAVRAAARAMTGGGSIVLVSSAAARLGLVNHEAIAAAKAGVIGLTLSAAATYAPKGLRVNAVAPGLVRTPMTARITGDETALKASRGPRMSRHTFAKRSRLEASADEVYGWHARPAAFERLNPPWDAALVVSRSGGIEEDGARVVLRVGPLRQRWVAEHHGAVPGREFHDRQVAGPFALWQHAHRMVPEGENACTLEDRIEYALPAGPVGDLVGGRAVRALLDRMFAYRHRVTAGDLAAHAACREGNPMKVAITGTSGLLGSALVPFLTTGGHEVVRLVRRAPKAKDEARWDPDAREIDAAALEGVDAVVHLAGENIAGGRWTGARKALLRSSRVGPTALLARTLAGLKKKPKVLVSASAIGYYGNRGDTWVTEKDAPADDFLGRLSVEWEAAAEPARKAGIRVVHPRIGVVLSPAGGALGKMLLPFKAGLGGVVGPGTQYMSWIALDDLLGVVHYLLDHADMEGPVNAAAPEPVTNAVFTKTLGRVLGRPTIAPVPAFALRLALGEMADAALLSSTRVRPERLQASGYRFRFPDLEGALRHVLGKTM